MKLRFDPDRRGSFIRAMKMTDFGCSIGLCLKTILIGLLISFLSATTCLAATVPSGYAEDMVIYKQEGHYSPFPSLTKGPEDQLWVGFGWNTIKSHYGGAAGGETGRETFYSPDGGTTWHQKGQDAQYQTHPGHNLVLSDGTILNVGPRMHEVISAELAADLISQGVNVKAWPDGTFSASYRVKMSRKLPGSNWVYSYIDLPPFAGMGGFGRGIVLSDNTIITPVYGKLTLDDPQSRAWALRSVDKGDSWELIDIAYDGVHNFNETGILALSDGRVLAMVRTTKGGILPERGFLWQVESDDSGKTWSSPKRTDVWGYPANLLLTADGDVLTTYGYRRTPYGIRASFSHDNAQTWDTDNEVILRHDAIPIGMDVGYPRTVELSDGSFFTAYYITLDDGITHIAATKWSRDYIGPTNLLRGPAVVAQPDPSLAAENIVGEGTSRR